jgi:hypothetical protein
MRSHRHHPLSTHDFFQFDFDFLNNSKTFVNPIVFIIYNIRKPNYTKIAQIFQGYRFYRFTGSMVSQSFYQRSVEGCGANEVLLLCSCLNQEIRSKT